MVQYQQTLLIWHPIIKVQYSASLTLCQLHLVWCMMYLYAFPGEVQSGRGSHRNNRLSKATRTKFNARDTNHNVDASGWLEKILRLTFSVRLYIDLFTPRLTIFLFLQILLLWAERIVWSNFELKLLQSMHKPLHSSWLVPLSISSWFPYEGRVEGLHEE